MPTDCHRMRRSPCRQNLHNKPLPIAEPEVPSPSCSQECASFSLKMAFRYPTPTHCDPRDAACFRGVARRFPKIGMSAPFTSVAIWEPLNILKQNTGQFQWSSNDQRARERCLLPLRWDAAKVPVFRAVPAEVRPVANPRRIGMGRYVPARATESRHSRQDRLPRVHRAQRQTPSAATGRDDR
jgi:hypothetical protein